MSIRLKKVLRYTSIYGIARTLTKVAGRKRGLFIFRPFFFNKDPFIGLLGCGQFQFSTIAFYLSKYHTNRFYFCYDVNKNNANSLAGFYKVPHIINNYEDIFKLQKTKLVYIASNHATHAEYAIEFLKKNVDVFCEKPICVNFNQFDSLLETIKNSSASFFAGYNRPYSKAIQKIKSQYKLKNNISKKFTLNCFISAHDIQKDHWYRNPEEGTRVCGNIGHWLDLMIHIYNWRGYIPKDFLVQIAYSNKKEPDDNISISITTPEGDLTSITISSRTEPFEGINETINFQYDTIIAKIDDFRKITIWDNEKKYTQKYFPKDVGHKRSVMQPFKKGNRDLSEVIASTELMLNITEMVINTITEKHIILTRKL